jgi:hypothetical protein
MPITVTPSTVFTPFGADAVPIITADAPTGLIEPFNNAVNGIAASRACLYSYLDWDQRVWTQGTLANTGNTGIWIGGINAIALLDTTATPDLVRVFNLSKPTQLNIGGSVLLGGTWYYLYAYVSGGALAFEATITPPEQNYFHWKNGAAFTHRYLGAFVTNSTGEPIPFYQLRGEHRYAFDEITPTGANSLVPWGTVTGPGATNVDISARVPPFTRPVRTILRVEGDNADAAPQSFTIAKGAAAFGGTIVLYHVGRPEAPLGGRGGRFGFDEAGPQGGGGDKADDCHDQEYHVG